MNGLPFAFPLKEPRRRALDRKDRFRSVSLYHEMIRRGWLLIFCRRCSHSSCSQLLGAAGLLLGSYVPSYIT